MIPAASIAMADMVAIGHGRNNREAAAEERNYTAQYCTRRTVAAAEERGACLTRNAVGHPVFHCTLEMSNALPSSEDTGASKMAQLHA